MEDVPEYTCDICGKEIFKSKDKHIKCISCSNTDICTSCFHNNRFPNEHQQNHILITVLSQHELSERETNKSNKEHHSFTLEDELELLTNMIYYRFDFETLSRVMTHPRSTSFLIRYFDKFIEEHGETPSSSPYYYSQDKEHYSEEQKENTTSCHSRDYFEGSSLNFIETNEEDEPQEEDSTFRPTFLEYFIAHSTSYYISLEALFSLKQFEQHFYHYHYPFLTKDNFLSHLARTLPSEMKTLRQKMSKHQVVSRYNHLSQQQLIDTVVSQCTFQLPSKRIRSSETYRKGHLRRSNPSIKRKNSIQHLHVIFPSKKRVACQEETESEDCLQDADINSILNQTKPPPSTTTIPDYSQCVSSRIHPSLFCNSSVLSIQNPYLYHSIRIKGRRRDCLLHSLLSRLYHREKKVQQRLVNKKKCYFIDSVLFLFCF